MTPDRHATPTAPGPVRPVPRDPSRHDVIRSGAELVALSERFYGAVFVPAIAFVGIAALAALVLLPVRQFARGTPVTAAAVATGLIVAVTPLAVWRAQSIYRALRRHIGLQLAAVLVAAGLVMHPGMSSELWWPSCSILMALAIVAPVRRALAYCLLVLATSLVGHLVAADLSETPAVAIIGLWIGYPLLVAAVAILTNRLAAHVLFLNVAEARGPSPEPPLPVRAWTTEPASAAHADDTPAAVTAAGGGPAPAAQDTEQLTDSLTARQLQVVALLADGLRHREIAECLSISERQVQRHVADAVARLGLRNAYELAAVAVSDGLVPGGTATAGR